jgi:lipoprotein-anchoring transpeptidase ErfK/SrfK
MRRTWPFVAVAAVAALVVAVVAGAYAYDSARSDVVAEGVRVAGVDVGGLSAEEARERLTNALVERAEQPLVATHDDRRFELSADDAGLRVDVERTVSSALERGRDGSLFERVVRDLRGHAVDEEVPLRVEWDDAALGEFSRSVAAEIAAEPRDAEVEPRADGLEMVEERPGLAVDPEELHAELARRLENPEQPRDVAVPTEELAPEVTTDDLAERYPRYITVDRAGTTLRLFQDLEETHVYDVAVGQHGHETPGGLYHIENKAENPAWHAPDRPWAGEFAGQVVPPDSPHNPIVSRWLGFHGGAGIHGTEELDSIGVAASRGCIRMTVPDVEELYDLVPVGTPIYVG